MTLEPKTNKPAMRKTEPGRLPTLSPEDHVQMLVDLMRPAGAELGRRWLSCLLIAPESDREAIVRSVERRMAELYLDLKPSQRTYGMPMAEHDVPIAAEATKAVCSRAQFASPG